MILKLNADATKYDEPHGKYCRIEVTKTVRTDMEQRNGRVVRTIGDDMAGALDCGATAGGLGFGAGAGAGADERAGAERAGDEVRELCRM